MQPGKDWSCRITDDLPHQLATFSYGLRSAGPGPLLRAAFPGMLLTCAGELCAAIGFDVEPGGILTITAPIFPGDHSAESHLVWGRKLLKQVLGEAARRRCCVVRFVQPLTNTDNSDAFIPLLSENGFSIRAGVVKWEKSYERDAEFQQSLDVEYQSLALSGIDVEAFSGDVLKTSVAERDKVLNLLREVLSTTHDLPNLSSPDAEDLLDDWIRHQATIIVSRRGGSGIAICVCVPEFDPDSTATAAIRIQYFGVIPEHRSTGVATGLLHLVPWVLEASEIPELADEIQLTALCDAANQPAMQLYRTCGFQSRADFNIWCHDVGS